MLTSPAIESITNTAYGTRTNSTVDAPDDIADGDRLVALVLMGGSGGAPTPTPPDGFTLLPGTWPFSVSSGGFDLDFYAYSKLASSESGDYTFTHANGVAQVTMIRVSSAGLFDPAPTQNTGSRTVSTASGLTTVEDGSLVIVAGFDWEDQSSITPPSGATPTFTGQLDVVNMFIASGVLATAGATGNKTWTNGNSDSADAPWGATMIAITPAQPPLDVTIRLSGGENNTDPTVSIGGAESTTEAGSDLLDNVTKAEANAGLVDYRCVYVHNGDASLSGAVIAYVSRQLTGTMEIAVGVAAEAAGEAVTETADDVTAPADVTFTAPTTLDDGVDLGTIGPGESRGLWIRRTVDADTAGSITDPWRVSLLVSTL